MKIGQHSTMNGGAVNGETRQCESMPPPEGGGRATSMIDVEERHPNGRKVRTDALPEYVQYRDGGCELAPSCLRCPLVHCRYDQPGGARALLQGSRDGAVQRRREEGVGIDALATEFGLSRRSVFRILARGRMRAGL